MKYFCEKCKSECEPHEGDFNFPPCKCDSPIWVREWRPVPKEIGGTHYQQGVSTSPWDLQLSMKSSGNAYVDARRADVIKYAFRMKGDLKKLAEDLRKAADCALAGAKEIEAMIEKTPSSI